MADRWEWRVFGPDFGPVEGQLRNAAKSVRSSREIYVLSVNSPENVKVRDGQLDVKTLDAVNAEGLQRWRPVIKSPFPVEQELVVDAFTRMGVLAPPLGRPSYSVDQWLNEAIHRVASLHVTHVVKERHGSEIDGCLVEIAYLAVDGSFVKTIGVEMEDPVNVARTVRGLGFDTHLNEDYVTALKRLAVRTL